MTTRVQFDDIERSEIQNEIIDMIESIVWNNTDFQCGCCLEVLDKLKYLLSLFTPDDNEYDCIINWIDDTLKGE